MFLIIGNLIIIYKLAQIGSEIIVILFSNQFRTDYGVVYVGLFVTIIPLVVVYLVLSKYIVAGVALGGVKG
mgnify:FL=1